MKISWRRERLPTLVFLSGEFYGQRGLAGYSSRGCKESDTIATNIFIFVLSPILPFLLSSPFQHHQRPVGHSRLFQDIALPFRMPLQTDLLSLFPLDYSTTPQPTVLASVLHSEVVPLSISAVLEYPSLPDSPAVAPTDSVQTSYLRDKGSSLALPASPSVPHYTPAILKS